MLSAKLLKRIAVSYTHLDVYKRQAVECGSRERGPVLTGRQGQFAQQSRAGAMRVLALEAFDEAGQLRSHRAGLSLSLIHI